MATALRRPGAHHSSGLEPGLHQSIESLASESHGGNDRHAQQSPHALMVDLESAPPGLVNQVERDHDRKAKIKQMEGEIQVPLQAGCVEDHQDGVRMGFEERLASHPLILRDGPDGIGAREIDDTDLLALEVGRPQVDGNGLPRVVGSEDSHPRQPVEDAGLSDIGIPGQRERQREPFPPASDLGVAAGDHSGLPDEDLRGHVAAESVLRPSEADEHRPAERGDLSDLEPGLWNEAQDGEVSQELSLLGLDPHDGPGHPGLEAIQRDGGVATKDAVGGWNRIPVRTGRGIAQELRQAVGHVM